MPIVKLNIFILAGYGAFLLFQFWRLHREFKGGSRSKPLRPSQRRFLVNLTLLIISLPLVLVSLSFHVNILAYKAPMDHSDAEQITFRDFRALKFPGSSLDGQNEFAYIVTTIDGVRIENGVEVRARFHPARSYVFNDKLEDDGLLRHELYHFHITELFARKIKRDLTLAGDVPEAAKLQATIAFYRRLENKMQHAYDEETYHSYVLGEQKRWEAKVDSLLEDYEEYKNRTIQFD